jgi:RNA polymerase sigma-70 factor (ECF subfamily)
VFTASPDEAEDHTQSTLLRMQRSPGGFGSQARDTTWLYRVPRSVAAVARRTRRRRAALLATQKPESASVHEPGIDVQRMVELIRNHFAELPVRQREVFDLVDLQGHAPAEVAEMLEMNPATVRVHLLRARRTMRERILRRHPALVAEREKT